MIFGLAALPVIIATGAAIDHTQMTADFQKAQDSADAAVLHAAHEYYRSYSRDFASLAAIDSARFHMQAETATGEHTVKTVATKQDDGTISLTSTISGTSRHAFMGIIGKSETEWTAVANSVVSIPEFEIVLVVDASHSMNGTKFDQLKVALAKFIDDVDPYKLGDSHVSITLLPYAEDVSLGQKSEVWADVKYGELNETNFNGCFKFSDSDHPGYMEPAVYGGNNKGIPFCPSAPAALFSTDGEQLKQSVIEMELGWGTDSERGLAWAERFLDARWRKEASDFSEGQPVNLTDRTNKIVVLLTDGAVAITDSNDNGVRDSRRLLRSSRKTSLSNFKKRCESLDKIENLDLYAVAYSVDNKQFENVLKSCVSGSGEYFDVEVGDLSDVFKRISESLAPIRITG